MAGWLENGFGIFALIVIWNIMLLGFGGISDSGLISDTTIPGYETVGSVNVQGIPGADVTSSSSISPTTTPEENVPYFDTAVNSANLIISIGGKIFFSSADMIEKSGIPSPINWVVGVFLRIFMLAYLGLFLFSIVSAWKGGGVGGA